jgi:hypothetical protein
MSISNPYGLNPGWKVDPDGRQDRKPSEVTTRQMTDEERVRYGLIEKPPARRVISFIKSEEAKEIRAKEREKMGRGHKLNVNTEDLLRICRIHGTGGSGYAAVAEELGMSWHTAKRYITEKGIVKLLKVAEENKLAAESVGNTTQNICYECVYGIPTNGELICQEGKNNKPVRINEPACGKFISVDDQSDINNHEEHVDDTEVTESIKEYLESVGNPPIPDNAQEQYEAFIEMHPPVEINVGNFINQPLPVETEEYPDLKEIGKDIKRQIDEVAKESVRKISLHNDVDEMMEMVPDNINSPKHYTMGGIDATDYVQAKLTPEGFEGFCIGVVIQYLSRYRMKGGTIDLKKAQWYLDRIIKVKETA